MLGFDPDSTNAERALYIIQTKGLIDPPGLVTYISTKYSFKMIFYYFNHNYNVSIIIVKESMT